MLVKSILVGQFRHFQNAFVPELGEINVFVGKNNAGKTSFFRAIVEGGEHVYLCAEVEQTNAPKHYSKWLHTSSTERISYLIWNKNEEFRSPPEIPLTGHATLHKDWVAVKVDSGPNTTQRYAEFIVERAKTLQASNRWKADRYFLRHRRRSTFAESDGKPHHKLEEEAQNLAGRLKQLRSGPKGLKLGQAIDDFVNEIIPGIGEVSVRTAKKSENIENPIEVCFSGSGKQRLTLDDLGGGVEQVLALALVLIGERYDHSGNERSGPLFLEEPEAHLHESAQRELVQQIRKHRGNRQIFIATHAPVFVNEFPSAAIYSVRREETDAVAAHGHIQKMADLRDMRGILDDLGVLPSTLLQTNFVIWVEGPTEVYLVTRWLKELASDLKLHQHFEFAETGGSNLVNYGAGILDDTSSDVLVNDNAKLHDMFKMCRQAFLICDKDAGVRTGPKHAERLKQLKKWLTEEYVWITDGYEIEWYYPLEALSKLWPKKLERIERLRECAAQDKAFYTVADIEHPDKTDVARRIAQMEMSSGLQEKRVRN